MGLRSTQGDETSIQQPLSMEAPPSPLSSRPKRSEVEGCSSLNRHLISDRSSALPFVIPTEAKRSGGICSSLNRYLISGGSSALPFVIPTEAKWRDLQFSQPVSDFGPKLRPPLCHPDRTEVEGSAVLSTGI
jgi:hypothetical protein